MTVSIADGVANGGPSTTPKTTEYGHVAANKILEQTVENDSQSKHPLVLQSFRLLIADLCQQFGGGHPG